MASSKWADTVQPVSLKATASSQYNNLSGQGNMVAYVHRADVLLVPTSALAAGAAQEAKVPNKDTWPVMQAKWCKPGATDYLAIASFGGVKVFDAAGSKMLFWYAMDAKPAGGTVQNFVRGVTACPGLIFAGTSTGKILAFDASGDTIVFSSALEKHTAAISELSSQLDGGGSGTKFASGDISGVVTVWDSAGNVPVGTVDAGNKHPVTSVRMRDERVFASFGSGHVRIFTSDCKPLVEIAAHSRFATALALHPTEDTFASVGLDTFVNIWRISDDNKVENVKSMAVKDASLQGAYFVGETGDLVLTAYDMKNMYVLKSA